MAAMRPDNIEDYKEATEGEKMKGSTSVRSTQVTDMMELARKGDESQVIS